MYNDLEGTMILHYASLKLTPHESVKERLGLL